MKGTSKSIAPEICASNGSPAIGGHCCPRFCNVGCLGMLRDHGWHIEAGETVPPVAAIGENDNGASLPLCLR